MPELDQLQFHGNLLSEHLLIELVLFKGRMELMR